MQLTQIGFPPVPGKRVPHVCFFRIRFLPRAQGYFCRGVAGQRAVQGSVKSWENMSGWGVSRTNFQARLSQGHFWRDVGTFLWDTKELRKQEMCLSLEEVAELGPF